jgi:hypothetical protein
MEYVAGVESLLGWIRRECLEELREAQSWGELHQRLSRNGLALQERGNGLVVRDEEGRTVKASSIARDLSKAQLVKRFGPFEAAGKQAQASRGQEGRVQKVEKLEKVDKVEKVYQPRPVSRESGTDELYRRYLAEQAFRRGARAQIRQELRSQKNILVSQAKARGRIKRRLIRQLDCDRFMKHMLYRQAGASLQEDIQAIHAQDKTRRSECFADAKPLSWLDWLAKQASLNDEAALAALRRRQRAAFSRANALLGAQEEVQQDGAGQGGMEQARDRQDRRNRGSAPGIRLDGLGLDGVTKQGTLIYTHGQGNGQSAIRDSGNRLEVSEGIRQDGLEIALAMAVKRFGPSVTIEGDEAFRARVLRTARALQLDIRFNGMAKGASQGVAQGTAQWQADAQAAQSRAGEQQSAGMHPEAADGAADEATDGAIDNAASNTVTAGSAGEEAARRYIAEREIKRQQIAGIPRHVLGKMQGMPQGKDIEYAGWRRVDGQFLLLARVSPDEIAVIPVDAGVITRMAQVKRGEKISLDKLEEAGAARLSRLPEGLSRGVSGGSGR